MKLEDRLRRDLPTSVDDVAPSPSSWTGVERGLVRRARRTAVSRVALVVVVLGGFVGVLVWAASSYLRSEPAPYLPATTPPPIQSSPSTGEVPGFKPGRAAFWTTDVGLAAGSANPCSNVCNGAIELTTDGGRTWHAVYRGEDVVADVATNGSQDAWAVVGSCREPGCDNLIIRSSDGGQTWTELGQAPVYQIDFASALAGWGMSVNAVPSGEPNQPLARTVDGGRTWQEVAGPCPQGAPVPSSVDFVDPTHGWIACVGDSATIQQGKAILETIDGGMSWRPVVEILNGGQTSGDLGLAGHSPALAFLPTGTGWLWMDRDCLYVWSNRGNSWQRIGGDICSPDVNIISDLQFLSARDGVALLQVSDASELQLIVSTNGGVSWSKMHAWSNT